MDSELWSMLIKIGIVLPLIIILINISLKYGGNKFQNMRNGKFIKIMERMSLSKDNNLLVAKIGKKGYVLASTNGKIEILMELSEDELSDIESSKSIPQYKSVKEIMEKLKLKKGR